MATSGVMADFARMPNQRKVLIFVVAAMLLAGVYYQFVFKGLKDDVAQAEQENQTKANTDRQLAGDIPRYEELKGKVKELELKIAENQKALPTQAEVPAFFDTLQHKVIESGVSIEKWRRLNDEPVDNFVRVPVEIEMTGTFMQIKRFFATLVQKGVVPATNEDGQPEKERIISIENLSLTNAVVRNREIVLTARFVAVTFRQEDKAATDALNAKPVSPQKPAAPLPPSTTPAGAKARVEQSLQKGAAQNANATGVDEAKTNGGSALKGGM